MKQISIEVSTCVECPYVFNDGRDEPWCTLSSRVMDHDDKVSGDYSFIIPSWCKLADV